MQYINVRKSTQNVLNIPGRFKKYSVRVGKPLSIIPNPEQKRLIHLIIKPLNLYMGKKITTKLKFNNDKLANIRYHDNRQK